jgi:hypothetical protein
MMRSDTGFSPLPIWSSQHPTIVQRQFGFVNGWKKFSHLEKYADFCVDHVDFYIKTLDGREKGYPSKHSHSARTVFRDTLFSLPAPRPVCFYSFFMSSGMEIPFSDKSFLRNSASDESCTEQLQKIDTHPIQELADYSQ